MKIGLIRHSFNPKDSNEKKIAQLAANTGNLVYWTAIERLFNTIEIPFSQPEKIKECDRVILTDLIWIKEDGNFKYLNKFIYEYNIPFVPMSVGLQSNDYNKDFKLPENTVRLLKKLQERATIGVRGYYTAEILNKYGIKNIDVIGCPSMYFWNNPKLNVHTDIDKPHNISSTFSFSIDSLGKYYSKIHSNSRQFLEYCADFDMQFIEQTSRTKIPFNQLDNEYLDKIYAWKKRKAFLPFTVTEWCKALENIDFSIGGRFHGNVISLWNGIKSLFLTVDSRTKEMTDFFKLPSMPQTEFDATKPIAYYYDKADYTAFNANYPKLYENFVNFVKKNGLEFDSKAKPLQFGSIAKFLKSLPEKYKDCGTQSDNDFIVRSTMEKNAIYLLGVKKEYRKITYDFRVTGAIKKYFSNQLPFTIEYDCNIESVPDSVANIPFMCLVLPICWLFDAELYVQELDKDFFDSIEQVKQGYIRMYPMFEFWGKIIVDKIVENKVDSTNRKSVALFSGGVDAFSTMLSNIHNRPTLLTIWGTDIFFENVDAWQIVKDRNAKIAKQFDLPFTTLKSAFRYTLDESQLTKFVRKKINGNWWHEFQHGISLIAQVAPYAYINDITDVLIASSYSVFDSNLTKCASYPSIDCALKFCGCKVYHDDFEKTRLDKTRNIVNYSKSHNQKIELRVCWEHITGENCCTCEKCLRTIFGIYAVDGDPRDFGFNITPQVEQQIINVLRTTGIANSFWKEIYEELYLRKDKLKNNKLVQELLAKFIGSANINYKKTIISDGYKQAKKELYEYLQKKLNVPIQQAKLEQFSIALSPQSSFDTKTGEMRCADTEPCWAILSKVYDYQQVKSTKLAINVQCMTLPDTRLNIAVRYNNGKDTVYLLVKQFDTHQCIETVSVYYDIPDNLQDCKDIDIAVYCNTKCARVYIHDIDISLE